MDDPRWAVSVKGVVRINGRVLLCMNHRQEWELPGGRPSPVDQSAPGEPGGFMEQPPETCAREILEETGITVEVEQSPLTAGTFEVVPGSWIVVITYAAKPITNTEPEISHEHLAVRLFSDDEVEALDNLPQFYKDAIALDS